MVYFTGWGRPSSVSTLRQYYHGTTTIILITVQLQSSREHSNSSPTRYCYTILSLFTFSWAPFTNCTFCPWLWPSSLGVPTFLIRCLNLGQLYISTKVGATQLPVQRLFHGVIFLYLVLFDCCPFPTPRDAMFSIGTSRWLKLYRISKYWRILKSASSVSYTFPSTFNL